MALLSVRVPPPNDLGEEKVEPYCVRPISTIEEYRTSSALVHAQYCRFGYLAPRPNGMRMFLRDFLSSTRVFGVFQGGIMRGTGTAYHDDLAGIPAQSLFPQQIEKLRAAGRTLIESSRFACDKTVRSIEEGSFKLSEIAAIITKLMFDYCAHFGADWVMIINPRMRNVYIEGLGFEELGTIEECPHVQNNPGLLLRLNVEELTERRELLTPFASQILQSALPTCGFDDRWTPYCSESLRRLISGDAAIVNEATQREKEAFYTQYPSVKEVIISLNAA